MGRRSPNTPDFPSWTGMYEQPPSAAGADNDLLDSLVLFGIRTGARWSYRVARLFFRLGSNINFVVAGLHGPPVMEI